LERSGIEGLDRYTDAEGPGPWMRFPRRQPQPRPPHGLRGQRQGVARPV